MKIIFLDVDGVLMNRKSLKVAYEKNQQPKPWPACIDELNRIIIATGAGVVLSSCWRLGRSVVEIGELLSAWGVVGKVIDRTPTLSTLCSQRGEEIQAWLDSY